MLLLPRAQVSGVSGRCEGVWCVFAEGCCSVGAPPMTLVAIPRGAVITIRELNRDEPVMVLSPCERKGVGYFCASCGVHCANVGNVLLHREASPPDVSHGIVRWCPSCQKYEACDQAQMDALTPERFL